MRVDMNRACDAAKVGYAAMAAHLDSSQPEAEPATFNDRLVAAAIIASAVAEAGGLSLDDFFGLVRAVNAPAQHPQ